METLKPPFYAKISLIFIGLISFIAALYFAQQIIVPVIYATIIAIVLSPLVVFFERKKMDRVLAITTSLLIFLLTTSLLIVVICSQFSMFTDTFPTLLIKFYDTLNRLGIWASEHFNISPKKVNQLIADIKTDILSYGKSSIGGTIATMGNMFILILLIPVYVFMILFYKPLLLDFIRKLFGKNNVTEVNEVLASTKTIVQRYLLALLLEAAIVATLNSVGLLVIGVDYAIVLGIMGAIVNAIPYIGGIISIALPVLVVLGTKDSSSYVLWVMAVYVVIQFIDVHYIVPKIVASKVKINALVSIIVVLSGGALWGIPGMFLSIPLTAIIKVIFDHIEDLKPWGFLLGDTIPAIRVLKIKTKEKVI